MRHRIRPTILLRLLLTGAAGAGSTYKWADDQGIVRFSDHAPEAGQVEGAIEKKLNAARRHKRYNPRGGGPITVINGRPIVGFAPAAFAQALKGS